MSENTLAKFKIYKLLEWYFKNNISYNSLIDFLIHTRNIKKGVVDYKFNLAQGQNSVYLFSLPEEKLCLQKQYKIANLTTNTEVEFSIKIDDFLGDYDSPPNLIMPDAIETGEFKLPIKGFFVIVGLKNNSTTNAMVKFKVDSLLMSFDFYEETFYPFIQLYIDSIKDRLNILSRGKVLDRKPPNFTYKPYGKPVKGALPELKYTYTYQCVECKSVINVEFDPVTGNIANSIFIDAYQYNLGDLNEEYLAFWEYGHYNCPLLQYINWNDFQLGLLNNVIVQI